MIARDAPMCAMFILNGVRDHFDTNANFSDFLTNVWDNGCVEFMGQINEFAKLSAKHIEYFAPLFENDGFPGVYHYEVDEPLGVELAKYLEAHWRESTNMPIYSAYLQDTLKRFATRFFAQGLPDSDRGINDWLLRLESIEQLQRAKELIQYRKAQADALVQ